MEVIRNLTEVERLIADVTTVKEETKELTNYDEVTLVLL